MPGSFNNVSQYGSPSAQATVPGSVVSTASVASPTGAAVSSPEDMVSTPCFPEFYFTAADYKTFLNKFSVSGKDKAK